MKAWSSHLPRPLTPSTVLQLCQQSPTVPRSKSYQPKDFQPQKPVISRIKRNVLSMLRSVILPLCSALASLDVLRIFDRIKLLKYIIQTEVVHDNRPFLLNFISKYLQSPSACPQVCGLWHYVLSVRILSCKIHEIFASELAVIQTNISFNIEFHFTSHLVYSSLPKQVIGKYFHIPVMQIFSPGFLLSHKADFMLINTFQFLLLHRSLTLVCRKLANFSPLIPVCLD